MKFQQIVFGLIVVVVLGAAAFIGGRLMTARAGGPDGMLPILPGADGGGAMTTMALKMEPAPELPQTEATIFGQLKRIENNSLFISDSQGMIQVQSVGSGSVAYSASSSTAPQPEGSGKETEIVVTEETEIYKDITEMQFNSGDGEVQEVQQKVSSITLDDFGKNGMVMVWGEHRGDRIIATTILYMGGN